MEKIDVNTWEEFECQLVLLEKKIQTHRATSGILFRGQANSNWPLRVSLETKPL
jgi:hypothetical protein